MPIVVVRDELAGMLGEVSRAVGRIMIERICWRRAITDHAAGKTKAA
jgi:hypothetical protein